MPTISFHSIIVLNNSVKKLEAIANETSLRDTPATKAKPPFMPLLTLCFMIVNRIGPTAMLNNNPKTIPFNSASVIIRNPHPYKGVHDLKYLNPFRGWGLTLYFLFF